MFALLLGNTLHRYGNCDFIIGSVAEIERLWSFADAYLDGDRNKTTPLLFEAMIFLRYNREFWNEKTIVKALKIVKENRMSARSSGMVAEDDLYVETHDLNEEITAP